MLLNLCSNLTGLASIDLLRDSCQSIDFWRLGLTIPIVVTLKAVSSRNLLYRESPTVESVAFGAARKRYSLGVTNEALSPIARSTSAHEFVADDLSVVGPYSGKAVTQYD